MMNSFSYALISAELLSAVICLVLLYGNLRETRRKTMRSAVYSVMVATNMVALIADAVSWILEGKAEYTVLLYVCTTVSVVLPIVMIGQFDLFIWTYISERKQLPGRILSIALTFCSVSALATLIACLCGNMFTYENGFYQIGVLYGGYVILNIFCLLVDIVFFFIYRKNLALHDRIAAYIYMALPALVAVVNVFLPDWSFVYCTTTISLVVLYVMIQSEQGRQMEKERELSRYYAMHDELTGLNSRHAYVERLDALSAADGNVGVIFGDVNALKYVNDHFGHVAGDKRLQSFAAMLTAVFPAEDVYKISGDEFVVLMPAEKQEAFDKDVEKLEAALAQDELRLASVGHAFGTCRNVNEMVQNAELTMYAQKNEFHRQHPETHR